MSTVDLSIIIISYNTKEITLACLSSIIAQTKVLRFEIIVVDNNSNDGSAEAINDNFPIVKLIQSPENLGFAKANNLAATMANGKYLLLLNPDTVILEEAIQTIYNFAQSSPQNQIYGGRTFTGEMKLNPSSCWRQQSIWSLFCYATGLTAVFRNSLVFDREAYGGWQRDDVREVDIVSGCFMLIERGCWTKLNGFDPQFFMYGEDADLCLRALSFGARPVIVPQAKLIHYGGASEKVRAEKMIRLFRAKELLLRAHWSSPAREVGYALYGLAVRIRIFLFAVFSALSKNRFSHSLLSWREIWHRRNEWHRP